MNACCNGLFQRPLLTLQVQNVALGRFQLKIACIEQRRYLITLYLAFETVSIPSYVLVGMRLDTPTPSLIVAVVDEILGGIGKKNKVDGLKIVLFIQLQLQIISIEGILLSIA